MSIFYKNISKNIREYLQPQTNDGAVAQLVEQRTENPCVTGSIPVSTTSPEIFGAFFVMCEL